MDLNAGKPVGRSVSPSPDGELSKKAFSMDIGQGCHYTSKNIANYCNASR